MIKKILKKIIKLVPFLLIVSALAGSSYYFYSHYQKAQYLLQNPDAATKEQTDTLLTQVGKLMELPKGETPKIATIIDASKLKNQPFFDSAMNGDKIIVYMNSKKAILFRPSIGKIIDVEPLYVETTPNPNPTPQSQPIKVSLYNGTTTTEMTQIAQTDLMTKFADIQVVSKNSAKNKTYAATIVVDLTGNNNTIASIIAKDLNATVTSLPPGETAPTNADLLIILGKNYGK